VASLITYCMQLERAVLRAQCMIDAGQTDLAHALIRVAAELAEERDLCGEISLEVEGRNIRTAADLRAAGRLH